MWYCCFDTCYCSLMGGSTAPVARDAVAVVGVGTTAFRRGSLRASAVTLAAEACRGALADAGLTAADVDGLAGTDVPVSALHGALGISALAWWTNTPRPAHFPVVEAAHALMAGACDVAVAYHS